MSRDLILRVTGFMASLILTLAAYFIILNPEVFPSDLRFAAIIIFCLALLQSLVQLVFFIDVWHEKTFWNLGIFISTVSIIFIVIFFSIWIINHLNYNMQ